MIYSRNCPQCNNLIEYPTQWQMKRCLGRVCKDCKNKKFGEIRNDSQLNVADKETEILSLYDSGLTKLQIKQKTGIGLKGITNVLKRNKVTISKGSQFDSTKQKVRQTNETNGFWVPKSLWEDWKHYKVESDWIYGSNCLQGLTNYDFERLKNIGFYDPVNNKNGLVRDHKYSRRSGFENEVFPELLRHPANLELITNVLNMRKWQVGKGKDTDSHSLDELFDSIQNNKWNWKEQDKCLTLIQEYKEGKRYKRL